MVVTGFEGTPCDHVHSHAQEILQILEQADVIKEGRAWLEIHEQMPGSKSTSRSRSLSG